MSAAAADHPVHEIIIVKRHGGDHDEGHHGGVWKIAFADFMTAMMCFFLVMWLINASNEQTKASVASYFNPVKLIDRNSSRKGLEDIGDGPNAVGMEAEIPEDAAKPKAGTEGQGETGPSQKPDSQEAIEAQVRSDEHLFADPFAVLAEIAAETGKLQNISSKGDGGAQDSGPATGASGGESYRDPFAPDFWAQQVTAPEEAVEIVNDSKPSRETGETQSARDAAPPVETARTATDKPKAKDNQSEDAKTADGGVKTAEIKSEAEAKPDARSEAEAEATPEATKAAERIRGELKEALKAIGPIADNITVTAKDGAVIISVTDQMNFGMFEIGSALPRAELVRAMEEIGKVVEAQPGDVSVGGHTDGRPFRSAAYDNWRLSSARAQSAYYMLVRGGLDERRIKEVAGYADRHLKIVGDPLAATNRRIEILIETKP